MTNEYRVVLFIRGLECHGSCVKCGTKADCLGTAARLNADRGDKITTEWRVLPCII